MAKINVIQLIGQQRLQLEEGFRQGKSHACRMRCRASTSVGRQWTGNAIDLVELTYGINETSCINNGNMPLKRLAPLLYKIFEVEQRTATVSTSTSNAGKTRAVLTSLTKCKKMNEKMLRGEDMERMRR